MTPDQLLDFATVLILVGSLSSWLIRGWFRPRQNPEETP